MIKSIHASPPRRGGPTTRKTLRRNKSAVDYNRPSSRGHGSRSSSCERSSGFLTQSSVGINFCFNLSGTCFNSAATYLNIVIAYYGSSNGNPEYNYLVLPIRRIPRVHGVNKVMHICWVNRNHYVQLLMNDDSSPLPLVHQAWRQAANNSCRYLERHFCSKISLWNKLLGLRLWPRDNTAEDAVNLDSS